MVTKEQLRDIFIEETETLVADLEDGLISLEQSPEDADLISSVFRSAHSIKGSAGIFNLRPIVDLTRAMEALLDQTRKAAIRLESDMFDVLLPLVDAMKRLLQQFKNGQTPALTDSDRETLNVLRRYTNTSDNPSDPEGSKTSNTPKKEVSVSRIFSIAMRFSEDILETGQDPLLLIDELAGLGRILFVKPDLKFLPAFEGLDIYKTYIAWKVTLRTTASMETIRNVFIFTADENEIEITDVTSEFEGDLALSDADKCIGELLVEEGYISEKDVSEALSQHKRTGEILVASGKVSPKAVEAVVKRQQKVRDIVTASAMRIKSEKLDQLVDMAGEMMVAAAQLKRNISLDSVTKAEKIAATETLAALSHELHQKILELR
ncbi:MAG: Hpt domain-containing protein [Myxococcota bacterium]|nr:Hpt domain-containing protein [Myxococcota bacterium]